MGLASTVIGMCLPRKSFNHKAFPYRSYAWENGGRIYERLGVKKWKTKVPDVSRIIKKMTSKTVSGHPDKEQMERLVAETCVAETVHTALMVFGWGCVFVWQGVGGVSVSVLYALGNVPFIIIQRYNRPRFAALAASLEAKKNA